MKPAVDAKVLYISIARFAENSILARNTWQVKSNDHSWDIRCRVSDWKYTSQHRVSVTPQAYEWLKLHSHTRQRPDWLQHCRTISLVASFYKTEGSWLMGRKWQTVQKVTWMTVAIAGWDLSCDLCTKTKMPVGIHFSFNLLMFSLFRHLIKSTSVGLLCSYFRILTVARKYIPCEVHKFMPLGRWLSQTVPFSPTVGLLMVALMLQCCTMLCIVAKRCVLEQKLLLTAYRKSCMRNWLVPKWMTLTFV